MFLNERPFAENDNPMFIVFCCSFGNNRDDGKFVSTTSAQVNETQWERTVLADRTVYPLPNLLIYFHKSLLNYLSGNVKIEQIKKLIAF